MSHIGRFAAATLLLVALILPQTINYEKSLLWCLPLYGGIAIAALIAAATTGLDFRKAGFCLATSFTFVGYIAMRAVTSPSTYAARNDLYCVLAVLVVYGLIASVISSSGFRLAVILALLCFAFLHVIVATVQRGFGENLLFLPGLQDIDRSRRASGFFISPNHLAGSLEVLGVFALSITCWSRFPKWSKVIVGWLAAACYVGVVLTGSRGGYFGVVASLIVFSALSFLILSSAGKSQLLKFGGSGFVLLAVAVVAGALFMQKDESNKRELFSIDKARLGLWSAAIEQWKIAPVIGTGTGTYLFYGREFRDAKMQADPVDTHSDYLQLLCEYGVIGAAAFLVFFFAHCLHGWRSFLRLGPERAAVGEFPFSNRLALVIAALSAVGAYIVHSAVDFNLHIPANALLLGLVFGVLANPGISLTPETSSRRLASFFKFAFVGLAIVLLCQCARLFPGEYYADQALTELENENPSGALSFANEALKWEKQNPNVFFCLGRALIAMGHDTSQMDVRSDYYKNATSAFEEARRLVPLDGTYPLEIASVYDQVGLFREAEEMFTIARERDPNSISVFRQYKAHLDAWRKVGK